MLPVLDRDLQRMPPGLKISNDRRDFPVAISIDDIAAIAVLEQLRIEPAVIGPGMRMRPYAGCSRRIGQLRIAEGASAIAHAALRWFKGVAPPVRFRKLTVCDGTVSRRDPSRGRNAGADVAPVLDGPGVSDQLVRPVRAVGCGIHHLRRVRSLRAAAW